MRLSLAVVALALLLAAVVAASAAPQWNRSARRLSFGLQRTAPLARVSAAVAAARADLQAVAEAAAPVPPNLPVGGDVQPMGIFYTPLSIGTPAVEFNIAIDSGSSDLLVPAMGCDGCKLNSSSEGYSAAASTTASAIGCNNGNQYQCQNCSSHPAAAAAPSGGACGFFNSYQTCDLNNPDQSCNVSGVLFRDQLHLGSLPGVAVTFGAIQQQSPNFQQFLITPGVMGLAYPAASEWQGPGVMDALVQQLQLADEWSLCLQRESGVLTLGGIDTALYAPATLQYTPVLNKALYSIWIDDVQVAGRSIGLAPITYNRFSVLDTGTNYFLLPANAFTAVAGLFLKQCQQLPHLPGICNTTAGNLLHGQCIDMSAADIAQFPAVTAVLRGNVKLTMPPQVYLVPLAGKICLGIASSGPHGFSILGDVNIQPYATVFDRAGGRLGFAPLNAGACTV